MEHLIHEPHNCCLLAGITKQAGYFLSMTCDWPKAGALSHYCWSREPLLLPFLSFFVCFILLWVLCSAEQRGLLMLFFSSIYPTWPCRMRPDALSVTHVMQNINFRLHHFLMPYCSLKYREQKINSEASEYREFEESRGACFCRWALCLVASKQITLITSYPCVQKLR